MKANKLELRQVGKHFKANGQTLEVLKDISFAVPEGAFITIIGPSGSGKSTLFNLIVGLLEPDGGEICLDGRIRQRRSGLVGYMPQRDLLLPWRTLVDNAIIPLEVRGIARQAARAQARELLPLFGLEDFGDHYPASLSGGMRQRAAFLRTILAERDLLLLDEPFGALDALTRRELQDWLLGLWQQFKQTVLFITHDVDEALYLADRVLVLGSRPGTIVESLEVALPRPRHQSMVATPEFGAQLAILLAALGIKD